jgi:hypothetical protein
MKTTGRRLAYGFLFCWGALLTSSCGGGGGDGSSAPPPSGTITFSTNAISFTAAAPYARTPVTQTLSGTVTGLTASGTIYILVVANNPNAFFTPSSVTIIGNSGQLNVIPAAPSTLKAGSFHGSITVTACLNDPSCHTGQLAGSPQTISVSYDIASAVDGNTVTPRVVTAATAGNVILRGAGFTGATSVSFGSVAATSLTVVNDSEIDAAYPALPAGTYPVTINSGSITYTASLVAVSPPGFTQALIPTGGAGPMEYDAERMALFVVIAGPDVSDTLLRYAYDGHAWGPPTQISMVNLVEVHLSPDGTRLLVWAENNSQTGVVELDPVTLAQTRYTAYPNGLYGLYCGFTLANDGNAIIGLEDGGAAVFGTSSRTFTPMPDGGCVGVASGNGAMVAMTGAVEYIASSETVTRPGPAGPGVWTSDFAGDKFAIGPQIQDKTGQILGYYPSANYNGVINPAGTRVYQYNPDTVNCAPTLSVFDLTAAPSGSPNPQFPALGSAIALPSVCHAATFGERLAITPDGTTVFIGTPDGVIVQPVSP